MDPGYDETLPLIRCENDISGVRYNGPFHEQSHFFALGGAMHKDAAVKSDHHSATRFARHGYRVTDHSQAIIRGVRWDGWYESRLSLGVDQSNGFQGLDYDMVKTMLDDAEARSITLARDGLRGGNFELGTAILEARSTADLFASKTSSLATAILALRRRAYYLPRGARNKLLLFAGAWLEGYYGWASLARDAFGFAEKLNEKLQPQLTVSSSSYTKNSHQGNWSWVSAEIDRKQEVDVSSKVKYMASIDIPLAREFDSWGIINPFSIAWEVMPYSFVIDWFVPFGNVLSSLSATAGLTLVDGSAARTYSGKTQRRYNNKNPFFTDTVVSPGSWTTEEFNFQRRLLAGFELPRLYANKNPFSTNRVTSAVALATQAVLGR